MVSYHNKKIKIIVSKIYICMSRTCESHPNYFDSNPNVNEKLDTE